MNPDVIAYYDRVASRYDRDRFENSYGRFIDTQERRVLDHFLPQCLAAVLDIGCGTGRLTDRAAFGCDASLPSLLLAAKRRAASFVAADAARLPFPSGALDGAFAFHVFMHLARSEIDLIFAEVARVLKPGGIFIADVASALRRRFRQRTNGGWHGRTALSAADLRTCGAAVGLRLDATRGVLMLPIHWLPHVARQPLATIDLAAAAAFPELSSYLVARFVKEPAHA
jgi:SAM-dependent methyltransferase